MALYFLLLDSATFHERIVPALSASWQKRSFEPCRPLCAELAPAAEAFVARYGPGPGKPLVTRVAEGLLFDRALWRHVAGEVLLHGAASVPDLPTAPDTLRCLLASHRSFERPPRTAFAPIDQAHFGACDLVFGGACYRPEQAGYNDTADVERLADYLAGIDTNRWSTASLALLPDLAAEEDRAEELAYARTCLEALQALYADARARRQVVVCENIEGALAS
jgi:hypothetical protein